MTMPYEGSLIRPPSEAYSLILQATVGCSMNRCTFCGAYREVKFRKRAFGEFVEHTNWVCRSHGWADEDVARVFLADGDALALTKQEIVPILDYLNGRFANLKRIGIYANAANVLSKTEADLRLFAEKKLEIAYLGLESGSDEVLKKVNKPSTAAEQVAAVQTLNNAGIKTSVMALLGLGGRDNWKEHALKTAEAANKMQPRYLSFLTVMLIPGTPLYRQREKAEFVLPDEAMLLRELRLIIENLNLKKTVLRSNHASNYLPIGGNLPKDKSDILETIDMAIKGEIALRPECFRGL